MTGQQCEECGEPFSRNYQVPTLCNRCWNEKQREATFGYLKADRNTEEQVIRAKARAKHGKR